MTHRPGTELLELIGEAALVRLAEAFGGTRLFVPVKMTPEHEIAQAIGIEAARALSARLAPDYIKVPLARAHRARQYRAAGRSNAQIARALGITETGVANLRTIVAVAKATGSVLLTWPSVGGAANSFGQDQTRLLWSAALRALASELGCAFVNEEALLGGRTVAQANGAFRDGIHEVDWAYDMEAAAIRQAIA